MKATHLEAALTRGAFRIGTLYEYRDIERLGGQIGDDSEGKKAIHLTAITPMRFDLLSDDPRAIHARKVFKGWDQFHPATRLIITMQENSALELNEESQDVYTYCVSMDHDVEQMRAFGYDACLVISDPQGFFAELSNCIPDADFIIGAEVQYRHRRVDYALPGVAPAVFLKAESYASQCEFRAIWQARSHPINPVVIECPRALYYCARLDVAA